MTKPIHEGGLALSNTSVGDSEDNIASTPTTSNPDWELFGPPSIPSDTRPVTAEDEWQQLVELLRNSPLTPLEIMKELKSRGFTTEQIQDVMDELSPGDHVIDVYLQKL